MVAPRLKQTCAGAPILELCKPEFRLRDHPQFATMIDNDILKEEIVTIRVQARVQGQWFIRYEDAPDAYPDNPEPSVVHTTWWNGRTLYYDPNPHPIDRGVNARRHQRKLEGVQEGRIVVMQVDIENEPGLRASGRYAGEFRVVEAIITENGSHALVLENTGREIVGAGRI
jgi:hypothetical protein